MSVVDVERPLLAISERHDTQSPHVIDVDSFDTEEIIEPPRQRRRISEDGHSIPGEVIFISDSDDEIQYIGSSQPTQRHHTRFGHRERIFSPPPPPQAGSIPPVPPIPQRYLPLIRRFPSLPISNGPIIANDRHFPFEADPRRISRQGENGQPPNVPAPAPPSHHIPSMGFGGALLAGVSHDLGPRRISARDHAYRRHNIPTLIMRWDPSDIFGEEEQADYSAANFDEVPFLGGVRRELEREFERRGHPHPPEPDYKPEYTHPNNPSPGFTHDFTLVLTPASSNSATQSDDSPVSSNAGTSRSGESTLACAQCHKSLILGVSDVEEGREERRLWGLRCGHLLDGKCIKKLMQPAAFVAESRPPDVKGKAKMGLGMPAMPSPTQENPVALSFVDTIRSRLRPRRGMLGPGRLQSSPGAASMPPHLKTSHGGHRGKGKGRAQVTVEHEWICPVFGCGRPHVSVFIDGRWIMDKVRGAIAVFV